MRRAIGSLVVVLLAARTAGAAFDTGAKVGAARNDTSGDHYACVVVDSTHLQCYYESSGSMVACTNQYALPTGYSIAGTSGDPGGVYLVPHFSNPIQGSSALGVLFIPVYNGNAGADQYEIMSRELVDVGSFPSCVYPLHSEPAPYITGNAHPYLPPRIAIAGGSGNDVYVLAVVPSGDSYAAGDVLIVQVGDNGLDTSWTWQYSTGHHGVFDGNYAADPASPVTGTRSSLTGEALFAVRDNTSFSTSTVSAIYLAGGSWNYSAPYALDNGGGATPDMATGIAASSVPVQVSGTKRKGDAIFAIDSNGDLQETRFECTNNAGVCQANSFDIMQAVSHGNNGSPYDATSDSLTASFYNAIVGGTLHSFATAYARIDSTHADSVHTDVVNNLITDTFSALIPGNSGWASGTDYFDGQQIDVTDVAMGSSHDWMLGACHDSGGADNLCVMKTTWGTWSFDWYHY